MTGQARGLTRRIALALSVLLLAMVGLGCAHSNPWVGAASTPVMAPVLDAGLYTPDLPCRLRAWKGRDKGMVVRRSTALFMRLTGYPNGRPGYVIDHRWPLCAGGCDVPSNEEWMPVAEALVKDVWERDYCAGRTKLTWCEWKAGH